MDNLDGYYNKMFMKLRTAKMNDDAWIDIKRYLAP